MREITDHSKLLSYVFSRLEKNFRMVEKSYNTDTTVEIPDDGLQTITVEDLYDKEKYDLTTMKVEDVFKLLEYVNQVFFFRNCILR